LWQAEQAGLSAEQVLRAEGLGAEQVLRAEQVLGAEGLGAEQAGLCLGAEQVLLGLEELLLGLEELLLGLEELLLGLEELLLGLLELLELLLGLEELLLGLYHHLLGLLELLELLRELLELLLGLEELLLGLLELLELLRELLELLELLRELLELLVLRDRRGLHHHLLGLHHLLRVREPILLRVLEPVLLLHLLLLRELLVVVLQAGASIAGAHLLRLEHVGGQHLVGVLLGTGAHPLDFVSKLVHHNRLLLAGGRPLGDLLGRRGADGGGSDDRNGIDVRVGQNGA
jgi:hypothetical protein